MSSYAYTIQYLEKRNQDFDCITAVSFDGSFGQESTFLANEPVYSERYDGIRIDYGTRYSEVAEIVINFVKKDYSDFSNEEKREILRWLTARKQNSWLDLYDQDGGEICQYYGRFTNVEARTADSRVIGFTCTFTSTYPWAFSPLRDIQRKFTKQETIIIENSSDVLDDMIRPYIVITPSDDIDTLTIHNKTTDRASIIKNIRSDETITIDNENKIIFSDYVEDSTLTIIGDNFYGYIDYSDPQRKYKTNYPLWIELVPGNNIICLSSESADAEISYQICYRCPMKIGGVF